MPTARNRRLQTDTATQELATIWDRNADRGNTSEAVYTTLREAILTGAVPAGRPLKEDALIQLFNCSRTPVREAGLRLEAERLVNRVARRGLVVVGIGREEILEVYAVREVLDGLAARLAAHGLLPNQYDRLVWLNDRMKRSAVAGNFAQMVEENIEFHVAVCEASRNSFLLEYLGNIHSWVRRFPETTFAHGGRALEAIKEHEAILNALKRRDPDAAERLAREHMARAMRVRVLMLQAHGAR